ncbi:MAG: sensor histidine kinase [Ignavibacteria bacterium]|nr:sensor histidine kinase [Ignavibacteria bacterium]
MHPILGNRERLAIYMLVWLMLGGMLAAVFALPKDFSWPEALSLAVPLTLLYGSICLSSYYLCRVFPLHKSGFAQLLLLHIIAGFLTSSLWILIGNGWVALLERLNLFPLLSARFVSKTPLLVGVGFILFSLTVAVHYLIMTFEASKESEQRELQLRILAQEAELKALRAQINPHFLFNSLNSISALTTQNATAARTMTLRLADFLRKSLRLGAQDSIRLEEEIALAMNFLEIEQIRFGSRLRVEKQIDGPCNNCLVPPLLLQPLVENAIHHGIAQLVDGGIIRLRVDWSGSVLHIQLQNPVDPDRPKNRKSGIGIENVRKRLRAIYYTDAELLTTEEDGWFTAAISLPAQTGGSYSHRLKRGGPNGLSDVSNK